MDDFHRALKTPGTKGCLGSVAGLVVLAVVSPVAAAVGLWRKWRRGENARVEVVVNPWPVEHGVPTERIDATIDVPASQGDEIRRRTTDVVIRIAEALKRPDDVFSMIYRLQSDEEAVVLPVGPQLQELGERVFLTLNQGVLAGRTVVWLTLGRDAALAEVVDPLTCDPEGEGEPEGLLSTSRARWTMASEWAPVGPSLLIRLVILVPAEYSPRIHQLLTSIG